jgi:hypothetical protein
LWLGDQLIMSAVARRGNGRFGNAPVSAKVEGMVVAERIVTYGLVTVDEATSVNR